MTKHEYVKELVLELKEVTYKNNEPVSRLVSDEWVIEELLKKCNLQEEKYGDFRLDVETITRFLEDEVVEKFITNALLKYSEEGLIDMSVGEDGELLYCKNEKMAKMFGI